MSNQADTIKDLKKKFDVAEDLYDMEIVMKETWAKGFRQEAEVMDQIIDFYKEKAATDADMAMDYYHGIA